MRTPLPLVTQRQGGTCSNEITGKSAEVFDRIFGLLMAEAVTGAAARELIMAAAAGLRE